MSGRGIHAMVVRGWEALARAGVETNILCTVNAANEDHGEQVYRYFRDDLGARYLQFIPIVERVRAADLAQAERGWRSGTSALLYRQDGDCVTSRSTSPASYGRFLCEVFDQWLATDVGEVFIQDVDSTLSAMFGSATVCVHAPQCGANMAMEFNGDVYACDHWGENAMNDCSVPAGGPRERMSRRMYGLSLFCVFAGAWGCPSKRCCVGGTWEVPRGGVAGREDA